MFCTHCGKEIADDARFCTHCGNSLNENVNAQEPPQPALKSQGVQKPSQPTIETKANPLPPQNIPVYNDTSSKQIPPVQDNSLYNQVAPPNQKSGNLGIKIFLGFVGCLVILLVILLVMVLSPKEPEYEIEDYYGMWKMDDTRANPKNINGKKDDGEWPDDIKDIYMEIDNDDEIWSVEIYEDGTINEVMYEIEDFDGYISFEYEGEDAPKDTEYRITKDDDELLVSIWSGKKALSHFIVYEESNKKYADLFTEENNTLEFTVTTSSDSETSDNTPSENKNKYEEGLYLIGTDIPAGEYKLFCDEEYGGYFEITEDGAEDSEIFTNSFFYGCSYALLPDGMYVDINRAYAIPTSKAKPFDLSSNDGKYADQSVYKVGFDIPAGTYKLIPNDADLSGMYQTYSNPNYSDIDSMIDIKLFDEDHLLVLEEGQYFTFSFCDLVSTDQTSTEEPAQLKTSSDYTFIDDSSHGMSYKVPSEFERDVLDNDFVYYYFDDALGFIMVHPSSDFGVNTLSDVLWDSYVAGLEGTDGYASTIPDKNLKIDGKDARIHYYVLKIGDVEYTAATAGFIKDNIFYTMGILTEEYYYDDYYAVFEDVLSTIKVQ